MGNESNYEKSIDNNETDSKINYENEAYLSNCQRRILMDKQIEKLPYCHIGQLHAQFLADNNLRGASKNGTAVLITHDLILTSAHNVIHQKKLPYLCNFTLGLHNSLGKRAVVIGYKIPFEFKGETDNTENSRKNDYALLKINQIFNQDELKVIKFMKLACNTFLSLPGFRVQIFGYPLHKNMELNPSFNLPQDIIINRQYGAEGNVRNSSEFFISYQISTTHGQSGSPIILKNQDNQYEIIGIHKGVAYQGIQHYNYGLKISQQMKINLEIWATELNSKTKLNFADNKKLLKQKVKEYWYGTYTGEMIDDNRSGFGVFQMKNGERYQGEWKNDNFHGNGIYCYSNGTEYDGQFEDGKRNGKGIYFYENKYNSDIFDTYEGEWKNDKKHGNGVYEFADSGNKYIGEWKCDKKDGKGIYLYSNINCKYEGEWKQDLRFGKGVYDLSNGDKYDGEWKDDKMNGRGIFYQISGEKYDGQYKDNEKCGQGSEYLTSGDIYEGKFLKNKRNGAGLMTKYNKRFVQTYKMGQLISEKQL